MKRESLIRSQRGCWNRSAAARHRQRGPSRKPEKDCGSGRLPHLTEAPGWENLNSRKVKESRPREFAVKKRSRKQETKKEKRGPLLSVTGRRRLKEKVRESQGLNLEKKGPGEKEDA